MLKLSVAPLQIMYIYDYIIYYILLYIRLYNILDYIVYDDVKFYP